MSYEDIVRAQQVRNRNAAEKLKCRRTGNLGRAGAVQVALIVHSSSTAWVARSLFCSDLLQWYYLYPPSRTGRIRCSVVDIHVL